MSDPLRQEGGAASQALPPVWQGHGDRPGPPAAKADEHAGAPTADVEEAEPEPAAADDEALPTAPQLTEPPPARRPSRVPGYLPAVVFALTTIALMPKALAGQATFAAVDIIEGTSPFRDAIGRLPFIASPIQTDQAEYFPALVRFWEQLREGAFQLWEPRFGAGNPLGTLPLMSMLSPLSLPMLVVPAWYGVTLRAAALLLVSQTFLYLFVRRLGVSRAIAILAAVAYTFSGSTLIFVHRMNAVFLLPAMLWAAHRLVTRPGLRSAALVAVFTAWTWLEGFPAAFLFNVYAAGAFVVWLVWRGAARRDEAATTRDVLATAGRQVGWYAVGSLWGLALSLINLLPFLTYVQANDLLEARTFDSNSHLPAVQMFGLFDLSIIGPLRDGPWWTGSNPVESITHAGMLVMLVAIAGLVAAAMGRLRLTAEGRDVWPFFAFTAVLLVVLTFIGTGVLGLAYRLPTLQDNQLHRARYILVLSLVVLAALAADAWLRRRVGGRELAPRRSTLVIGLLLFALAMTALDDLTRLAWVANQGKEVLGSAARGVLVTAIAVVAFVLARRWPRLIVPATLVGAAVLWAQLAWPLRDFTPQAPKEDFYTTQAGHEVLRELAGDQYRFAAAGFEVLPNSSQLWGGYDLRGLALRSEDLKALVRSANPTAFDRDPLKILLTPEEWNLTAPAYDELAVRYFALGTSNIPYGRDVPIDEVWTSWDPLEADAEWEVELPAAPSGIQIPLAAREAACERTWLTVTLSQDGEVLDETSRPAYDAPGNWLAFGLTGQDLDTSRPATLSVRVEEPGCAMDIGLLDPGTGKRPAIRLIVEDPEQGVRLVATEQAWIYERPSAKPIIRVDDRWRAYDSQDLLLADLAAGELDAATGPGVLGEAPTPVGGERRPRVLSSTFGDDVVRVQVEAGGPALVTVAQANVDGWSVTVDGQEADLVAVDGALQGVFVDAGEHEVVFRFAPTSFAVARVVSGLALLGLIATGIWVLVTRQRDRARRRPPDPVAAA